MKNFSEFLKNFYITEMTIKLGEFRNNSEGIINQIIENWCLVKWCDMYPNELTSKRLRNHWVTELINHMLRINNIKLKGSRKDKALHNLVIKTLEYNDWIEIAKVIRNKFEKERLEKYINIISEECANNIENICNILCSDENTIKEYVNGYME